MNNIALGKYIPGNSFIHKLDPRNKILIMILFTTAIMKPCKILKELLWNFLKTQ